MEASPNKALGFAERMQQKAGHYATAPFDCSCPCLCLLESLLELILLSLLIIFELLNKPCVLGFVLKQMLLQQMPCMTGLGTANACKRAVNDCEAAVRQV